MHSHTVQGALYPGKEGGATMRAGEQKEVLYQGMDSDEHCSLSSVSGKEDHVGSGKSMS